MTTTDDRHSQTGAVWRSRRSRATWDGLDVDYVETVTRRSDAEFYAWRAATIAAEQADIDSALANGAEFALNTRGDGAAIVHTLTCHNVRLKLDRAAAWDERPITASDAAHGMGGPKMIDLLTRVEIEQRGKRYTRCQICAPDVPEYVKKPRRDDLLATSLRDHHVGRRLIRADGVDHGVIERVVHVAVVTTDQGTIYVPSDERINARHIE